MTGCYRAVHALGRPGRREHLALLILELNIVMIFRSVRAVALAPLRPIVGALDNIRTWGRASADGQSRRMQCCWSWVASRRGRRESGYGVSASSRSGGR